MAIYPPIGLASPEIPNQAVQARWKRQQGIAVNPLEHTSKHLATQHAGSRGTSA
jgi:hypothetical protein